MAKDDEVWADEGGKAVRFTGDEHGAVHIAIVEKSGRESIVLAEATVASWRWARIVEAMK